MTEEDWQKYRATQVGIGGSDISTIIGVNPYKSKFTLWLEKTGQKAHDVIENNAIEWGNILEPVIRDKFKRETGFKVFKNNFVLQHDSIDWMVANLDGECIDPSQKGRGVLEIKTTNERNKKQWEEGCPIYYMAQVQWYLAITGYTYGYIAVLIGGSTFKYYLIERDDYLIDTMINYGQAFMNHVENNIPPEIGGSKNESEWLAQKYPQDIEEEMTIPPSIEEMAAEYMELNSQIKEMQSRCDEIKNQIKLEGKEFRTLRGSSVRINMPTIRKVLFDSRLFKIDNPELYEKYKIKESSYRSFDVSFLEDKS